MAVNNRVKISNDIELKDRLVAINRVTKVTKGGRTFTFAAIVVMVTFFQDFWKIVLVLMM